MDTTVPRPAERERGRERQQRDREPREPRETAETAQTAEVPGEQRCCGEQSAEVVCGVGAPRARRTRRP